MTPDLHRLRHVLAGTVFSLVVLPGFALAGPVTATIENIPDDQGTIRVAVCTEDEFLKPTCHYNSEVKATSPTVSISFTDIPAGTYAVQAYQDRNGNAKLDRSFLGIPKEPIGFSRNPALHYGPPSFEDCAVELREAGGALNVTLRTR